MKQSDKQKCSKCLIEKPLADFSKVRATSTNYRKTCKRCVVEYSKIWAERNKEKLRQHARQRRIKKFGVYVPTRKPGATAKVCTKCRFEKPLNEFPLDSRYSDNRASGCKACKLIQTTDWRRRNVDRVNARRRERAAIKKAVNLGGNFSLMEF